MTRFLAAGLLLLCVLWLGACQPNGRLIDPLPDPPMGALLAERETIGPPDGDGIRPPNPPAPPKPAPPGEAGWKPTRPSERWTHIVIHHSASAEGNAALFDKWHKNRGWDGLGYHFVIDNGRGGPDGRVEVGYRWRDQFHGAHTDGQGLGVHRRAELKYYNQHGIGICLVGDFMKTRPTERQMRSLVKLCAYLIAHYRLPTANIIGHRDTKKTTECPGRNFSVAGLKRRLTSAK